MPPPSSLNSAIASVKYHVQQWINLVLYNSIYQNLILLYLYRIFKCLYGFFDHSTELSRICGANNWPTPLDSLWDSEGEVTSGIVNDKHLGTIAFTNAANPTAHIHLRASNGFTPTAAAVLPANGQARRGSVQQAGPAGTSTATTTTATTTTTTTTTTAATAGNRNSTDSARSTQSSQDSGSDLERRTVVVPDSEASIPFTSSSARVVEDAPAIQPQGGGALGHELFSTSSVDSIVSATNQSKTELKHRKKRSTSSTVSNTSHTSNGSGNGSKVNRNGQHRDHHLGSTNGAHHGVMMDLRQSRSAAGMVYRIDRCILFSKQLTLERRELEQAECDPIQITQQILRKKRFPDGGSPSTPAAKKLQYALDKVASTHQLAREINQRVHTKYDSTNPAHERKLLLLWDLLRPQEKLDGRYTKQWTEIGFQGKDPATDFRGMGMLGLDDLVYYAKHYPQSSKHALECSHDEISWYSYAIVGINITAFAVQTLRTRQLQYYLFLNGTDRSVYHELYCYLFHRFNGFWTTLDPKPSIMDFERVFADFKIMMERQLARRKLMMLRFDTKEQLGSGGYPVTHPHQQDKHSHQSQSREGEAFELETKKAK